MCERRTSALEVSNVLTRHPRHPSLIHLRKYNVKERRKLFEKLPEEIPSSNASNTNTIQNAPQPGISHCRTTLNVVVNGNLQKSKLQDVSEEDVNSNYISDSHGKSAFLNKKTETVRESYSIKNFNNLTERINFPAGNYFTERSKPDEKSAASKNPVSPPIPVFTPKFKSSLQVKPSKPGPVVGNPHHLNSEPYRSTLVSKVVWPGIPELPREKSEENESGVFLNDGDRLSDENLSSPIKTFVKTGQNDPCERTDSVGEPTTSLSRGSALKPVVCDYKDLQYFPTYSRNTLEKKLSLTDQPKQLYRNPSQETIAGSISSQTASLQSKPILPPKPPRVLNQLSQQLSYSPMRERSERPRRSTSSVYESLANTHSSVPQPAPHSRLLEKSSTFPSKSPASPEERTLEDGAHSPSIPQDLYLCRTVGVAEKKERFERQNSEVSSSSLKPILIKKSAADEGSKVNQLFRPVKSKKFVTKKHITNPSYEYVGPRKGDEVISGRTSVQSRVTFKEEVDSPAAFRSKTQKENRNGFFPLGKKFTSVNDEQWKKMLDGKLEEPTYATPCPVDKKIVNRYDVAFDQAGYAIPSCDASANDDEEVEEEDERNEKSAYMRVFSKEERYYVKSKVSDAYSILRGGSGLIDDIPAPLMSRSVSAGNIPRTGSASDRVDILEHERRLNYVSTVKRLTFKNVSKYERLKSTLNVGLFEYSLVVGLRPKDEGEDDDEDERGDDPDSSSFKPVTLFSWPENLTESQQMTYRFCFPDVNVQDSNTYLSGEMFHFFLTTENGDRKFCWCLRYLPDDTGYPEAVCVVSAIGEAGLYQQLLNGVRQAREHSFDLAREALKSAHVLKFPRPNKELYINAVDLDGFRYTGVIKRITDSQYSTARFGTLVNSLPISLLIQVIATILLERRVILLAHDLSTLSSCIMSLSTLIYPFSWPHTLITVLPPTLLDLVDSPTPYILGMFSTYRDFLDQADLDEVLVVDLDRGSFMRSEGDEGRILPKRIQKALMLALSDVPRDDKTRSCYITDVTVTEAFVRMFVEMCGHYAGFISHTPATGNVFQREEFVKSVSSSSIRLFLDWFSRTQMFQVFVADRLKESFEPDLFEQRIEEYKRELDGMAGNAANMKQIRNKFVNFFKNYGTKIKKTLKKNS